MIRRILRGRRRKPTPATQEPAIPPPYTTPHIISRATTKQAEGNETMPTPSLPPSLPLSPIRVVAAAPPATIAATAKKTSGSIDQAVFQIKSYHGSIHGASAVLDTHTQKLVKIRAMVQHIAPLYGLPTEPVLSKLIALSEVMCRLVTTTQGGEWPLNELHHAMDEVEKVAREFFYSLPLDMSLTQANESSCGAIQINAPICLKLEEPLPGETKLVSRVVEGNQVVDGFQVNSAIFVDSELFLFLFKKLLVVAGPR
ncbi:hypothetical protein B0T18DRAFT_417192 [Schizothecium vesticola]|uniref:Uncharacterized protein n=1 Tax=Schizothecium vesticola TaxID=314040 RepID=A0AA40BTH9_9PEZI|nr:hypothetical protein B0T18DRAFT_417192 [Schizothecium vesticola]